MKFVANVVFKNYNFYCHRRRTVQIATCCLSKRWQSSSAAAAPKRVCIVGAGPAGFYAAQYILKHLDNAAVDVIEKLPVPFGLVRFGVAPDHPEVKNVINTFTKTAANARFRFLGNVCLGKDVSLAELRQNYHAVLLTYGADRDRHMNIPNENQPNVLSARKFVEWYNGLPGSENLKPDLSGESVTIVGQGNVAIDVARMILCPVDDLRSTDITDYALEGLANSKVKRVYLVGRRGPLQAAFTIKELREMLKLQNVQTLWKKEDFVDIPDQLPNLQRPRKRLTELMLKSLQEQNEKLDSSHGKKQFLPVFLRAPKSIIVPNEIEFNVTKLQDNIAIATQDTERFPADLVMRSIGYQSTCVDGGICFDERSGHIYNQNGRVLKDSNSRTIDKGLYVAGWLGTGPTGVILTTMNGAFAVAKSICDDITKQEIDTSGNKAGLSLQNKRVVTWEGWCKIDKAETEAGKAKSKPREKIVDIEKMISIAGV